MEGAPAAGHSSKPRGAQLDKATKKLQKQHQVDIYLIPVHLHTGGLPSHPAKGLASINTSEENTFEDPKTRTL